MSCLAHLHAYVKLTDNPEAIPADTYFRLIYPT